MIVPSPEQVVDDEAEPVQLAEDGHGPTQQPAALKMITPVTKEKASLRCLVEIVDGRPFKGPTQQPAALL